MTTIIRRAAAGFEDLAASSLLKEALEALIAAAAPHWSGSTIADVPGMIQELARDRDEYKCMAESYRADLAKTESEIRNWKLRSATECNCAWEHEEWCNVYTKDLQ